MIQLIHWFTRGEKERKETMVLLESIAEAVGQAGNSALREYAADVSGGSTRCSPTGLAEAC